jgi:hypothetical protein
MGHCRIRLQCDRDMLAEPSLKARFSCYREHSVKNNVPIDVVPWFGTRVIGTSSLTPTIRVS